MENKMYSPIESYKAKINRLNQARFDCNTLEESIAVSRRITHLEELIQYEENKK